MNNFHEILINQLAKESSFVTDDGELKKFIIIDAAFNMNRKLIELLLEVPEIKQKFFTEISGHWVFDINLFVQYMENKNFLKDSYTRYRNKIGLNIGDKFLNQRNEVALVWPFKDCILEGGQSRDDQKRPEIFFNEILAQEEINQLTEPKVLTNWKRYTVDGEKEVTEIKRENGTIKENLIIKGNNLLALHSLLPQFEEKVKLIYIDPPYNTGGDSFLYNDSFNHSTWLTFMKNRLVEARKLMHKEGLIYIQCDENENSYLKVLLDEIFGRSNYLTQISWQRQPEGRTVLGQGSTFIVGSTEFILLYSKNISFAPNTNKIFKEVDATEKVIEQYSNYFNTEGERKFYKEISDSQGNPIKIYEHENFEIERIPKTDNLDTRIINFDKLSRIAAQQEESSLQQKIMAELDNSKLYSIEYIPKSGRSKGDMKKSFYYNGGIVLILKDYAFSENNRIFRRAGMNNFWSHDEIQVTGISEEGKVNLKRGKKPEKLLKRIIEMSTSEGDIVLDYHLGSGTTCAVAHKMKRQYIGIEQLDYGKNDSTIRLKNVIGKKIKEQGEMFDKVQFDQSGISKAVSWQGGGEFVYCELKKYNQTFIEQIEAAETSGRLLEIWEEMKVHSFLNYNVDIKKQDEAMGDFKLLSIETQKQHLCEILNKNQLYVNLSSIDDEDYQVSEEDKRLTRDFYEIKEEQEAVQTKADL
jgi:adenine-specific DNA-methyltransferase